MSQLVQVRQWQAERSGVITRGLTLDGVLCHYFRCWEPVLEHRALSESEHWRCLQRQLRELVR